MLGSKRKCFVMEDSDKIDNENNYSKCISKVIPKLIIDSISIVGPKIKSYIDFDSSGNEINNSKSTSKAAQKQITDAITAGSPERNNCGDSDDSNIYNHDAVPKKLFTDYSNDSTFMTALS